jgi:hypothetical protein
MFCIFQSASVIAANALAAKRAAEASGDAQKSGSGGSGGDKTEESDAWMGALRSMTIVFVNVMKLDLTASDAFERLQQTVFLSQLVLYSFEGTMKEFVLDDKGSVVVAVFGLPPYTHEVRSIYAPCLFERFDAGSSPPTLPIRFLSLPSLISAIVSFYEPISLFHRTTLRAPSSSRCASKRSFKSSGSTARAASLPATATAASLARRCAASTALSAKR